MKLMNRIEALASDMNRASFGVKSKAVSPQASPAFASYDCHDNRAPQEVTKKRCRATPPALRLLAQPPVRFPAFLATNGRLRTRSLRSLRHAEPDCPDRHDKRGCDTRRRRRRGAGSSRAEAGRDTHPTFGGHPSASMAPRSAGPGGKRRAACLSDRRERVRRVPPGPSIAGDPAHFAGRLRGMSGFAYFCRNKSRSHQPAKLAAKQPLT